MDSLFTSNTIMPSPYQPPQSTVFDAENNQYLQRSKVPKVVGIILLILTVFGAVSMMAILGMLLSGSQIMISTYEKQGLNLIYVYLTMFLGLIASIWLLYTSIQLIKYRDRGRRFYNYYMVYALISMPVSFAYQTYVRPDSSDFNAIMMGVAGTAVSLLIYGLFWYLLNKEKTKASLN